MAYAFNDNKSRKQSKSAWIDIPKSSNILESSIMKYSIAASETVTLALNIDFKALTAGRNITLTSSVPEEIKPVARGEGLSFVRHLGVFLTNEYKRVSVRIDNAGIYIRAMDNVAEGDWVVVEPQYNPKY